MHGWDASARRLWLIASSVEPCYIFERGSPNETDRPFCAPPALSLKCPRRRYPLRGVTSDEFLFAVLGDSLKRTWLHHHHQFNETLSIVTFSKPADSETAQIFCSMCFSTRQNLSLLANETMSFTEDFPIILSSSRFGLRTAAAARE